MNIRHLLYFENSPKQLDPTIVVLKSCHLEPIHLEVLAIVY